MPKGDRPPPVQARACDNRPREGDMRINDMLLAEFEEEMKSTRRTLERYVAKNLVKEVLENPDSYYSSLRGVRVPVTILFSDLIGFTTLSEKADPEVLVTQLNEYLSSMTSVIFSNGGTALVSHAKPDDMKTDPAGNAGDRIACGVITKQ